MVATFPAHEPVTPAGKPLNVAPVAPVVANVIVAIAVFKQIVWLVPAAIVFNGVTVIVPVVMTAAHPPEAATVYVTVYIPGILKLGVIAPVLALMFKPVVEL